MINDNLACHSVHVLQIGVVGIDSRNISRIPTVVSQNRAEPKVIPVCTDSLPQVESFVTSFSPQEGSTDFSYPRAFQAALSMFTNSTSVGKDSCQFNYTIRA